MSIYDSNNIDELYSEEDVYDYIEEPTDCKVMKTKRQRLGELLTDDLLRQKLNLVKDIANEEHHFLDVISNAKTVCEQYVYEDDLEDFYNVSIWFLDNLNMWSARDGAYYYSPMQQRIVSRASECLMLCCADDKEVNRRVEELLKTVQVSL